MIWPFTRKARELPKPTRSCSFCLESNMVVGPLAEGPRNATICGGCAERARGVFAQRPLELGESPNCCFCRKRRDRTGPVFKAAGGTVICRECVELVLSILEQEKKRRSSQAETR